MNLWPIPIALRVEHRSWARPRGASPECQSIGWQALREAARDLRGVCDVNWVFVAPRRSGGSRRSRAGGYVLTDVVVHRQFQRDPQEIERVHRHRRGAVGLVDMAPGRQRLRAIEHADVVQTQETERGQVQRAFGPWMNRKEWTIGLPLMRRLPWAATLR